MLAGGRQWLTEIGNKASESSVRRHRSAQLDRAALTTEELAGIPSG
jgi:hypothetical protein